MGKLFRDYRKQPRWLPLIFRFIALIGCRSIELCPEEFWSALLDKDLTGFRPTCLRIDLPMSGYLPSTEVLD